MTEAYGDLVETISLVTFTSVRLREGYDMSEADALLDAIVAALGRGEPVADLIDAARLTVVRLHEGYDRTEVDAFLAQVRRDASA